MGDLDFRSQNWKITGRENISGSLTQPNARVIKTHGKVA